MKKFVLAIGIILLFLIVTAVLTIKKTMAPTNNAITNFEQCVAAGNPATTSYPGQCRTPDGRVFTQDVPPKNTQGDEGSNNVSNFEECKAAGNPVLESFPEQCRTPDGRSFTRELTEEEKKKLNPPSDQPSQTICTNQCGNNQCEEIVCMGSGCPCPETPDSCPQDCKADEQSSMPIPDGWELN